MILGGLDTRWIANMIYSISGYYFLLDCSLPVFNQWHFCNVFGLGGREGARRKEQNHIWFSKVECPENREFGENG